jgi:hypothetical protein
MGLVDTLPQSGLIAITWAGAGLAGLFVAARTTIRIFKIEQLRTDDYLIYAAFIVLLINAVLQTLQTPSAYTVAQAEEGLIPFDDNLVDQGDMYMKYEFTIIGLFWTVLWLVKASFLAFFYPLFEGLIVYRRIWWGISIFSFLAFASCWISSVNTCHPVSTYFLFGK